MERRMLAPIPGICRSQKRRAVNSSTGRLRPGAGSAAAIGPLTSLETDMSSTTASVSHIGRAMRFELRTVWPATHRWRSGTRGRRGQPVLRGLRSEVSEPPSILTRPADGTYMFGRMQRHVLRTTAAGSLLPQARRASFSAPGRSTKGGSLPPTRPDHG